MCKRSERNEVIKKGRRLGEAWEIEDGWSQVYINEWREDGPLDQNLREEKKLGFQGSYKCAYKVKE